mmetsp:Transcript_18363/g.38258  ORF Transcript_18363/g.38258 Transcript_18363/m.38258 type:complete len:200 (-) Transcript_18363:360-959(-)
MNHELNRAIQYRSSPLCAIRHDRKCRNRFGTTTSLVTAKFVFLFFVHIDSGVDGVVIPCNGLRDRQFPSRAVIAPALYEFSAVRVGVKSSIVLDHGIVAGYHFLSVSILYGYGAYLVFDLHVGNSRENASYRLHPRFLVFGVDFRTDSGMGDSGIDRWNDSKLLGGCTRSEDVGTRILGTVAVDTIPGRIEGGIIAPRA